MHTPKFDHSHGGPAHSHGGPAHTHETGIGTPASSASVALDIGGGRGALIIYPTERYRGLEIEISPANGGTHRIHTGVHERSSAEGSALTAIFGSLPAGPYVIWEDETIAGETVTVPDGAIAEVHLRELVSAAPGAAEVVDDCLGKRGAAALTG
jgi:hypothetical protein